MTGDASRSPTVLGRRSVRGWFQTLNKRAWGEVLVPGGTWHSQLRRYRGMVAALVLLQIVAYGYLFTVPIFTDHTFPNSWLYPYPSFKTDGEGRWLADLVILLQGGSGVPFVQMVGAALLQALNGVLFACLLGVRRGLPLFVLGGLIGLHPAFLDYYSFAADHLSFVLGDSFAVLAAWVLLRGQGPAFRLGGAALLNMLALALYGPKIALVLLLALLMLLLRVVEAEPPGPDPRALLGEIGVACGSVLLAVLAFGLSARLVIRHPILPGAHLNTLPEMAAALVASYGKGLHYLGGMAGLPSGALRLLPVLLVLLGLLALGGRLRRLGWPQRSVAMLTILLLPVALNGASIINNSSPGDRGRFVAAYAYGLVFFLAQAMRVRWLRYPALALAALVLWFFLALAMQQTNAAQFKNTYELAMINRILSRLEPLITATSDQPAQPVLIVGRYPPFDLGPYVRWRGDVDAPHLLASEIFAPYRQTEMLNYLLGRELLRRPSAAEIDHALPRLRGTPPWPAQESVFRDGRTIVVTLEPWRADMPMTWDDKH